MTQVARRTFVSESEHAGLGDVERFLDLLWEFGDVREVRIPKHNKYRQTASGYFDTPGEVAKAVRHWNGRANVYITLNPVDRALMARANGRIVENAEHTTSDADIARRSWLFIDIDPVRPSGVSATPDEVAHACQTALAVQAHLSNRGWPDPARASSGNGYYLLYRVELPNDSETNVRCANVLRALAGQFDNGYAHIDTTVSNAARIIGVVGTLKMKGDEVDERVHRRSFLDAVPSTLTAVPRELLNGLAQTTERDPSASTLAPVDEGRPTRGGKSLVSILEQAGIEYREQPADANGITWYHVRRCPWHDDGKEFECGVGQHLPDGPLASHCFHPEGRDRHWRDWREALGLGSVRGTGRPIGEHRSGELPEIVVSDRQIHEIAESAWEVVAASNVPPWLFENGGTVAEVRTDGGDERIEHSNVVRLKGRIDRLASWRALDRHGSLVAVWPPKDVVEDMLAFPSLPSLRGLTGVPIVMRDGTIESRPGYHCPSGLFYVPGGRDVRPVPERPTDDDICRANALLFDEWLVDFRFANHSSRTHAVAAALTLIARELFDGTCPMFAIDAPAQGTGKTYLAQSIALIGSGRAAPVTTMPHDDDELRKRITAQLRQGRRVVQLDNVKTQIRSQELAALLTSSQLEDRLLGTNTMLMLENRLLLLATGNNMDFDADIARRTVSVRLDAAVDRPWERSGFKHDRFLSWVHDNRHELQWALLVLARNWFCQGCPPWMGTPMGSFESWGSVVGGILLAAGILGFLENRDEMYARVDPESEEWRHFVRCWWERFGDQPVGVAELFALVAEHDALGSVFARSRDEASERSRKTTLGKALRRHEDRVYGQLAIRRVGTNSATGAQTFRLEPTEPGGTRVRGSGDVPVDSAPIPDSPAERSEHSEPQRDSYARDDEATAVRVNSGALANEVPDVQDVRLPDSDWHDRVPELPRNLAESVDEVREGAAQPCPRCGERPTVAGRMCFRCEKP